MHATHQILGSQQPLALLSGEADNALMMKVLVPAGAALPAGAVIGRITASKKYQLSVAAATDGSQVPDMVLAEPVEAGAADVEVMAWYTGTFNSAALTFGEGHSKASTFESLRGKGIYLD